MSRFLCIGNVRFHKFLLEGFATAQYLVLRAQPDIHVCIENTLFIRFLFSFSLRNTCLAITAFNARWIFSWVIDKRTTYVSQGNIKLKQIDLPVFNTLWTNSNESYLWLYYLLSYTRITVILSNKLGVTLQRCPYGREI